MCCGIDSERQMIHRYQTTVEINKRCWMLGSRSIMSPLTPKTILRVYDYQRRMGENFCVQHQQQISVKIVKMIFDMAVECKSIFHSVALEKSRVGFIEKLSSPLLLFSCTIFPTRVMLARLLCIKFRVKLFTINKENLIYAHMFGRLVSLSLSLPFFFGYRRKLFFSEQIFSFVHFRVGSENFRQKALAIGMSQI